MALRLLLLFVCWLPGSAAPAQPIEGAISAMTFNIRYDTPGNEQSWENRRSMVVASIRLYELDFLGIQEALHHQLVDLDKTLPVMGRIGVARDDGKAQGEYSALFYDSTRWEIDTAGTFWLSETPDQPGKGWDAVCPRIVTWGVFQEKSEGGKVLVLNTHFDHVGEEARQESARLILKHISPWRQNKVPVILMGDFNMQDQGSLPYTLLTDTLQDAYRAADLAESVTSRTFNHFSCDSTLGSRIDYFFLENGWQVDRYEVVDSCWDGRVASDHFPVYVKLRLLP